MLAAGDVATAAAWNVITNDVIDHETYVAGIRTGYQAYTPTLTQSGAVTKTVTVARYIQIGKLVTVYFELIVSGAGGVASNKILISLPVTAEATGVNQFTTVGQVTVYDASSGLVYPGLVIRNNTTTNAFTTTKTAVAVNSQYLGVTDFSAALATGDYVGGSFTYEAA